MAKSSPTQLRIRNKKAHLRFEILDKVECGLVLRGTEVKSLREGRATLEEAYAQLQRGEVWLYGFHIPPYSHGNVQNHEPMRPRKLLLHKQQIGRLTPKVTQRGLTLVPLQVYFSARGLVKVELALVRGKARQDKRQDLKKREHKREMDRVLRRRR
ncbi:MAG TPA: SsrA-binding protein SmpB [Phycisphaerae bacterium]|nr:SsrA-binding protein SmpB [Phycisphaerae bacterium]